MKVSCGRSDVQVEGSPSGSLAKWKPVVKGCVKKVWCGSQVSQWKPVQVEASYGSV